VLHFTDTDCLTNPEGVADEIEQTLATQPSPVLGPSGRRPASPRGRGDG
jgi:hypothetical protein